MSFILSRRPVANGIMTGQPLRMTAAEPYHHGSLRQTLIDLASDHIAHDGVDSLSVRALARSAGVAHRAAYQHFPDRDALVAAVLAAGYLRLAERCDKAVRPRASWDARLEAVARAYSDFAFDEPQLFIAMTGPRVNSGGAYLDLETALGRAWRHIAEPISAGITSGEITINDKRAAAAIFWGGLQGVLFQAILNRLKLKPAERRTFMRLVAKRLIAGLAA